MECLDDVLGLVLFVGLCYGLYKYVILPGQEKKKRGAKPDDSGDDTTVQK